MKFYKKEGIRSLVISIAILVAFHLAFGQGVKFSGGYKVSGGFNVTTYTPGALSFNVPIASLTANNTSSCSGVNTPSTGCRFAFAGLSDHYAQSDGSHSYTPPGPPTTVAASNTQTKTPMAAPHNINISSMKSLAYGTFASGGGKVVCYLQPWWKSPSSGGHIDVGQQSDDAGLVQSKAQNMLARGCDVVAIDWYGGASYENTVAIKYRDYLDTCNCALKLAIVEDGGTQTGSVSVATLETDLTTIYNSFIGHTSYWKITDRNGFTNRPVVETFGWNGLASSGWSTVRSWIRSTLGGGFTGNNEIILASENETPLSDANRGGGYNWIGVDSPCGVYYDNANPGAANIVGLAGSSQYDTHFDNSVVGCHSSDVNSWYTQANSTSGTWLVAIGSTYKGFNDTNADWGFNSSSPQGQGRKVAEQCGQIWVNSWSRLVSTNPVKMLGVVTWDDYEEGTGIESGISNCYTNPTLSLVGSNLTVTLNASDVTYSSLITVQNVLVYASLDNINAALIATLPASSSQVLDLTTTSLVVGQTYKIYAFQQGKPGIFNYLSSFVTYTR
jgi:hypothetical protein